MDFPSVRCLYGNYPFPNPREQTASAFGYLSLCCYTVAEHHAVFCLSDTIGTSSQGRALVNCGILIILLLFCCLAVNSTPIQ